MEVVTLRNEQISVSITNLGATIISIHTPDRNGVMKNVVAGFSDLQQYENNEAYFGCIIGRYANRITAGRFTLGAETVQLSLNDGVNHLHGGFEGFHKKEWTIVSVNDQQVILEYLSKDGEEGYPGNLLVTVAYILDGGKLKIQYHAVTDKPTPVNLTNHSYFNLSAFEHPVITDHLLWINADHYTSNNADHLPDGQIREVAGTALDFRVSKRIEGDLNHNYVLNNGPAARLYDPLTGRQLEVFTDQPGLQVYSAYLWDGIPYAKHGAVALETQAFPDSPNHPAFPATILYPGDVYERYTVYAFSLTA